MPQAFFCADPHFGHKGVTQFLKSDGSKLRPWDTTEEMDEALVENWNKVVKPDDKVYVGGDVVINRKALATVGRLNGKKHLIKGNHDIFRISEYLEYFYEVSACRVFKDFIFTHIPLHTSQLDRFTVNVHGHLHAHQIMRNVPWNSPLVYPYELPDPRYVCVSMEQIDFTPIHIDVLREKIAKRQKFFDDMVA